LMIVFLMMRALGPGARGFSPNCHAALPRIDDKG
jgi:hypothetical protein